jgi:hypothetical protein
MSPPKQLFRLEIEFHYRLRTEASALATPPACVQAVPCNPAVIRSSLSGSACSTCNPAANGRAHALTRRVRYDELTNRWPESIQRGIHTTASGTMTMQRPLLD